MEMRRLGRHGPEVSVVGYGAWEAGGESWGTPKPDEVNLEAMRAALDAGMNWIDTAESYGHGHSEELVGRVVKERAGEALVFTKVAPFISGIRPEQVRSAVQGSLKRLGVETIDLYQVHWPDDAVSIEDTWGAMAELVEEGLVRYIGVSNFDRELVERCMRIRHVDSVQNQFSLLWQEDRAELLPWLDEQGIGYLAYGPLAYGLLTGAITKDTTFDKDDWRSGTGQFGYYLELFAPGRLEPNLERVARLRSVAERLDVPITALTLRAELDLRGVTAVIAGSTDARHVRSNATAGDLKLDPETLAEIERIFS